MDKIRKILFPTDFSKNAKHAFVYALKLSHKMKASIQVLHVVQPIYEPIDLPVIDDKNTKSLVEKAVISIKSFIEDCTKEAKLESAKINKLIQTNIEVGNPVSTICRIVERDGIDLMILGSKGLNSLSEKIMGSVSTGVMNSADCDIMVIPKSANISKISTAVFASNFKDTDPFEIWKAVKILDQNEFAIKAIHVNQEKDIHNYKSRMDEFESYFNENNPNLDISFKVIPGENIAAKIIDYTHEVNGDAIIMSLQKRNILEKLLHKSVSKKLVRITDIPILLLKEK